MKRKCLTLVLAILMLCVTVPAAHASGAIAQDAADQLYRLGLFSGVGSNADGTPNYDLDRVPTRNEATTMLVRLLGKEEEAETGTWEIPFTDVADWAKPYVGYAYANGLTKGTSEKTFGGNDLTSATQYLTFVLRALGYDSNTDFQWNRAWELSDQIGITRGEYDVNATFLRGDVAIISYAALSATLKDGGMTLADYLIDSGVFNRADYLDEFDKSNSDSKTNQSSENESSTEDFRIESVHYEWDWLQWRWSYDLLIPVDAVEYYRGLERNPYLILTGYTSYVSDTMDDNYLKALANVFVNTANENNFYKDDAVQLAISFVQSLNYMPDDSTLAYDYPKYPLETLYDRGGDCEDTSILLVSLIREMGYGCCLIEFTDHMGVGILGSDNISGRYFEWNGRKYFYVETTGKNWEIGEMPDDYINQTAQIWPF